MAHSLFTCTHMPCDLFFSAEALMAIRFGKFAPKSVFVFSNFLEEDSQKVQPEEFKGISLFFFFVSQIQTFSVSVNEPLWHINLGVQHFYKVGFHSIYIQYLLLCSLHSVVLSYEYCIYLYVRNTTNNQDILDGYLELYKTVHRSSNQTCP